MRTWKPPQKFKYKGKTWVLIKFDHDAECVHYGKSNRTNEDEKFIFDIAYLKDGLQRGKDGVWVFV